MTIFEKNTKNREKGYLKYHYKKSENYTAMDYDHEVLSNAQKKSKNGDQAYINKLNITKRRSSKDSIELRYLMD